MQLAALLLVAAGLVAVALSWTLLRNTLLYVAGAVLVAVGLTVATSGHQLRRVVLPVGALVLAMAVPFTLVTATYAPAGTAFPAREGRLPGMRLPSTFALTPDLLGTYDRLTDELAAVGRDGVVRWTREVRAEGVTPLIRRLPGERLLTLERAPRGDQQTTWTILDATTGEVFAAGPNDPAGSVTAATERGFVAESCTPGADERTCRYHFVDDGGNTLWTVDGLDRPIRTAIPDDFTMSASLGAPLAPTTFATGRDGDGVDIRSATTGEVLLSTSDALVVSALPDTVVVFDRGDGDPSVCGVTVLHHDPVGASARTEAALPCDLVPVGDDDGLRPTLQTGRALAWSVGVDDEHKGGTDTVVLDLDEATHRTLGTPTSWWEASEGAILGSGLVATLTDGHLAVVDLDGAPRWSTPVTAPEWVRVQQGLVIVAHDGPSLPLQDLFGYARRGTQIAVYDASTGSRITTTRTTGDNVINDGRLIAEDATTGELRLITTD